MGKERVGRMETGTLKHVHHHVQTGSSWEAAVYHRELSLLLCDILRGGMGVGGKFEREGTFVYL